MSSSLIVEKFEQWRSASCEIALVTVFETVGSTYSKPGHRILIGPHGDHEGLVSGGCLEGDLAEHAARAIEDRAARSVTYDLRDEADELFGLGIGCNGLLRMLVQPLLPETDYAPFPDIAAAMLEHRHSVIATVVASSDVGVVPGATLVRSGTASSAYGIPESLGARLEAEMTGVRGSGIARLVELDGITALIAPLARIPRILILGGGIDAVPIVEIARRLGWRIDVADHRPAYLGRTAFADVATTLVEPGRIGAELTLDAYDAIVVMSHHLATDESYLRELAAVTCPYLGVLGPPARKEKLLGAIGAAGGTLEERLHGPVGLDVGADSPETIALSIIAEVQLVLSGKPSLR